MAYVQPSCPFDLFRQLVLWLTASMHAPFEGRHYLEANAELLSKEAERELDRLVQAHHEEQPELTRQMQEHLNLLRDAQRRGEHPYAIRDAYINAYGGCALDMPQWLIDIEQHSRFLARLHRPERTNRNHAELLRQTLARLQREMSSASIIIAEFQNRVGDILTRSTHYVTQQSRIQAVEEAIAHHEAAHQVFTAAQYPQQYQKTLLFLGRAYHHYAILGKQTAIISAIACYRAALHLSIPDQATEVSAKLQTALGSALVHYYKGGGKQLIEQAIAHHTVALTFIGHGQEAATWAMAQANLGTAYRQRIVGSKAENLERAMKCYRAALQIYNRQSYPQEWAAMHIYLASTFEQMPDSDKERHDVRIRCAIVCCESALQVYTSESFPIEYAETQMYLGQLHQQRQQGHRLTHLSLAYKSYRRALRIFTLSAFPLKYHQIQQQLTSIETQLQEQEQPLRWVTPSTWKAQTTREG